MLNNQDIGPQQRGMNRACAATGVVDIVRINANQGRALFYKIGRGIGSEKWMIFKVRLR